jgi:hypothetical protein
MCNAEFSSQIAADAIHSRWNGELVRKVALLPNFLKGVTYEGFGSLETRGDVVCRIIPPGEMVRISLPQSGDPVGRLHLSGFSDENGQCRLVMTLGNQLMKDLVIDSPRWNVEIALPLPAACHIQRCTCTPDTGGIACQMLCSDCRVALPPVANLLSTVSRCNQESIFAGALRLS